MLYRNQLMRSAGLTAIELMMVMAIAAVLIAIVVPSFRSAVQTATTTREINAFVGDLGFARAEAIKEGVAVTICASSDGATCSGTNAWQNGWIIYSNPNLANTTIVALRKQIAFTSNDTLKADNATSSINFSSEGFTMSLPANPVTFTLQTAPVTTSLTQCVAINIAGRHVMQKSGTGNCP